MAEPTPGARDRDGMGECPTCGSLVCVVEDDYRTGASHYEPVGSQQVDLLSRKLTEAVEENARLTALISMLGGERDSAVSELETALRELERLGEIRP